MLPLRSVLVTVALATAVVALPAGAARAQNCGGYSDEMTGPGGATSPARSAPPPRERP